MEPNIEFHQLAQCPISLYKLKIHPVATIAEASNFSHKPAKIRLASLFSMTEHDHDDKPPIFILADRGTGQRYMILAKDADESTIRLLLANRKEESLTVYADGFRAYEPLEEDDSFDREYVVRRQ